MPRTMPDNPQDELDGMPAAAHRVTTKVRGTVRVEYVEGDDLPRVGDSFRVQRTGKVIAVNHGEDPARSADKIDVIVKLEEYEG